MKINIQRTTGKRIISVNSNIILCSKEIDLSDDYSGNIKHSSGKSKDIFIGYVIEVELFNI